MNKLFVQSITVGESFLGRRLDFFLAESLKITRSAAQKKIRDELVSFDDEVLSPKRQVKTGEEYSLFDFEPVQPTDIQIIHEDDDVIVVNKPSGLTTHPAPGEKDVTLTEALGQKVYVVHRLDKGTSGVIILAKSEKAALFLKKQFATRQVKKEYLTLIKGSLEDEHGTIDLNLDRSNKQRGKIVPSKEGRSAITDYKIKERYAGYTLVSAHPRTGRTHQIRTHFASIGHPIYGDIRYGNDAGKERIFLHSYILEITLPSGKRNAFIAPLPSELEQILTRL